MRSEVALFGVDGDFTVSWPAKEDKNGTVVIVDKHAKVNSENHQ